MSEAIAKMRAEQYRVYTDHAHNVFVEPQARLNAYQRHYIARYQKQLAAALWQELTDIADSFAVFGASRDGALALLDDHDIQLIQSGAEPNIVAFWRTCAQRLAETKGF